jgi:putative ABC transport system permease protein
MRLLTSLRQFFDDLRAQKLRTALTIMGITWGTVAIVVLLAFGAGLERQMKKNARGIGDGIVIIFPGRTTKAFEGFGEGRAIRLREEDVALLEREVAEIGEISPEYNTRVPARRGAATTNPLITGVVPVYGDMRNVIVEPGGRFLNELDISHRRRVAVLGDQVKRLLFGQEDALGQEIVLGSASFLVIGVMAKKTQDSSYGTRDENRVFIPTSTHAAVFGNRYLNNIIYRPTDPRLSGAATQRLYEVLGRKYRFDPSDKDAIWVWDTADMMKIFTYLFLGFNIFLGVVGSFTLTVGGIGVANIMYIVVRERTREIGIKRSLGARKRSILFQFFFETSVIVALGATLGLMISGLMIWGVGLLPIEEYVGRATVSPMVLGAALSLLVVIAFLAGLFPARKAANLDPVECLRY